MRYPCFTTLINFFHSKPLNANIEHFPRLKKTRIYLLLYWSDKGSKDTTLFNAMKGLLYHFWSTEFKLILWIGIPLFKPLNRK